MMKKHLFTLLLLATFVFQSVAFGQTAVKITSAERKMADAITAEQLSSYLHFVASDAMGGRDTPSQGLDLTAEFIKMNLAKWGFKGAAENGSFFQRMDMSRQRINAAGTSATVNGQPLAYGTDFLASVIAGTVANAPLVFAGDGWMVKPSGREPLKGIDAKGKVVVVYSEGGPRGMTFQQLNAAGKQGVDWADPVSYARESGAVGVIYLASRSSITNWERTRRQRETGGGYAVEKLRPAPPASIPAISLSQKASEALMAGENVDYAKIVATYATPEGLPSFALNGGKSAAFTVATDTERARTQNVVALWEGSDPVLKNEMIAIGAHYDHVGTNPNAPGDDKIWNGADDDGSGTVAVLAIAEALATSKVRPKRSVLFVWHCAEEKGLLGAEYFNKYPTVDIKNVVAQLNIDMIGRSKKEGDTNPRNKDLTGENAIYLIGSEMMSSTLGAVTKGTNDAFLKLTYDYKYDDPKDTNRFFFRSDHFHYAQNGIPIAFWFDGVHEDYHGAGDHPDKIDYAKMEKVTRTIFLTMWELTDLKERPKVDKSLPAELTQRN
jgi:Peptidase family M28